MAPLPGTAPAIAPREAGGGDRHTAFRLAAHPASVGTLRREAREELRRWGLAAAVCDDVVLIVSELVTNAVVHSAGDTVTCLLRGGPEIYVEVGSEGRGGFRCDARSEDEGGRGLLVVEALSTTWGVHVASPGAGWTAWATLTVPAPARSGAAAHAEDPR